jgi:hypothetical protein
LLPVSLDHYNEFRILPRAVRDEFRARFELYFLRKGNRLSASVQQNVDSILAEMEAAGISEEERHERIVNFMHFVNDMDASRRLSFRSIAPDTYDAVSAYVGRWDAATRHA